MGVDAEVEETTTTADETKTNTNWNAALNPVEEEGVATSVQGEGANATPNPIPLTYRVYSSSFTPDTEIAVDTKENKAFALKVTSANKSSGGGFKFKQASNGGGSKGAARRSGGGGGGGKKGGGGGKGKKAKDPKKIDVKTEKSDRYHDVNLQLEKISKNYDRLAKAEEKLTGKKLLDNLNQQLKILEKQKKTLQEKQKIQQGELKELQTSLSKTGVKFDSEGYMTNYNAEFDKRAKEIENMQKKYNKMTSEEKQEAYKEKIEAKEEEFDKWKEQTERYDELLSEEIPDIQDAIQDAIDQQIEINITKFNYTIGVRLDWNEAIRDYNEFKEKVDRDFFEPKDNQGKNLYEDKNGTIANAYRSLADYESYFDDGTGTGGLIQHETSHIGDILKEIDKLNNGEESSVYIDDRVAAFEDLKEHTDNLMDALGDLKDLADDIHDDYMDIIDEANEAFDNQVDTYEYIDDMLEHDMNVMGLIYGDEAYAQMANYYAQRKKNNIQELDFMKKRADFAKQMYDAETDPEAKEEWKKQWLDAQAEVNDKFEEQLELIMDEYTNAVDLTFQKLNDKLSNGMGMDFLEDEWDLMEKESDQWLDTVNSLFGVTQLENKYRDAINNTDNVHGQQVLNDLMESELAMLRDKDRLSQYDLDRANKKYEIALKQLALENAEQSKSKMRLRRDSQGNYSYQFVEDEDEIGKLRDDLLVLQNDLYNMDLEKYKDNLQTIYQYNLDYQEAIRELELEAQREIQAIRNDTTLSEEERAAREQEIIEKKTAKEQELTQKHEDIINRLVEDNLGIRDNLQDSATQALKGYYDQDQENFTEMTGHNLDEFLGMDGQIKDDMMNELVPAWDSGMQSMTDKINESGGLRETYEETFDELTQATKDYQDSIEEAASVAGMNLEELSDGYDANIELVEQLIEDNDDLIDKYEAEVEAIQEVIENLEELIDKYKEAYDAAMQMVDASMKQQKQEATNILSNTDKTDDNKKNNTNDNKKKNQTKTNTNDDKKQNKTPVAKKSTGRTDKENYGVAIAIWNGNYGWGNDPQRSQRLQAKGFDVSKIRNLVNNVVDPAVRSGAWENKWYGINHSNLGNYAYSKFKSGGYTGEWGDTGRLAVLHQKELVLNQADTKNILHAVNLVRDLNQSMGGRVAGMLDSVRGGFSLQGTNSAVEQNVHITAEFPGVRDSKEIEDALNNLINSASQYAFKTRP